MNTTTTEVGGVRPTTVAFTNCFDATTFGRLVYLTAQEKRRLRNVLSALHDYGHILKASLVPALPALSFVEVIDHLRTSVGAPLANAALAAAERSFRSTEPAPAARRLIPDDVGPQPTVDDCLVRRKHVVAETKTGVEEGPVVLAGSIQILDNSEQAGAVELGQISLDVTPCRRGFRGPGGHHAAPG